MRDELNARSRVARAPIVVMLGEPGSGKGTQCARLAGMLDLVHISIGDLLRTEVAVGSACGRRADEYMATGRLVPDELVFEALRRCLERHEDAPGLLLDGFPRSIAQARTLNGLPVGVRLAVSVVVPQATVIRRLAARGRTDDGPLMVRRRIVTYECETRPVLDWFAERGLLVHVDGNRTPDEVTSALLALVGDRLHERR